MKSKSNTIDQQHLYVRTMAATSFSHGILAIFSFRLMEFAVLLFKC